MPTIVESEMREFFQKIIDSVAELSTQASKVEPLTEQVRQLTERVNQFELDNRTLMSQVNEAKEVASRLDNEVAMTRGQLENERAVTHSLRETIVQRDAGVVQLEQSFRNEQDSHKLTTSERDDARQRVAELERELQDIHSRYNDLSTDRDQWRGKASELEATNVSLKQQIERIQSVLNPLRVVSGDVVQSA